ncbi:MAG TPA: ATP-binding protein [Vicinamibacterales bacterium]|nr:ATP-binding protein [Vicinamibacterales bacterium]
MLRVAMAVILAAFVAGVAILLATAPPLYFIADRATRMQHDAIAEACAAEVQAMGSQPLGDTLDALRARYGLDGIQVDTAGRPSVTSGTIASRGGERLVRRRGLETINIYFPPSPLPEILRHFRIAATVGSIATLAGLVLVVVYALTLARSGGEGRRAAAGGFTDTYETSIRALKGKADELKKRADELANISATLVRSLTSGFIAIDHEGLLLDMNQTARELLGIEPARAVEHRRVIDALGQSQFATVLQNAIDSQATLQRQEVVDRIGDDERIIGLSTVTLVDEKHRHLGMIALFTDLTPVRRLETRLRDMQSLADLGEMSAGIAHEFRNSLSTILGYLKLAQKDAPSPAAERVRSAEHEARLLTEAVESLLSFARPVSLDLQPLDARELMRETAERLQATQEIDIEFRGTPAIIQGDATLLRRAFENILRNAIDAIEESHRKGHIVIESGGGAVPRLTITDNGVGIADEDAARLFLPFQSRKPKGFGLGLALTKKIVLLHGGWIRLSGHPGAGATVTIEFPGERSEAAAG